MAGANTQTIYYTNLGRENKLWKLLSLARGCYLLVEPKDIDREHRVTLNWTARCVCMGRLLIVCERKFVPFNYVFRTIHNGSV